MGGGIESLVADKTDAFRGNPDGLQRNFQLNKQLVDLLALQKIKSEKDAAARQIQLQMAQQQGTPQTIAQQREQELLTNTKQDMISQLGGTAQKQAADMQAMQAPAAPPEESQGGIMGLAKGGAVKGYAEGGLTSGEMQHMQGTGSREKIIEFLKSLGIYGTPAEDVNKDLAYGEARAKVKNSPDYPGMEAEAAGDAGIGNAVTQPRISAPNFIQPPDETTESSSTQTTSKRDQGIGALFTPTRVEPKEMPFPELDALAKARMDPKYSANQAEEERGIASKYLGLPPEQKAAMEAARSRIQDLDTKQLDPEKLRRQRLIAFLIAAGKGNNLAAGLTSGGGASAQLRGEQEKTERERMLERNKANEDLMGLERNANAGVYNAGAKAGEKAESGVNTAMQVAAEGRRDAMQASDRAADRQQAAQLEAMREKAQMEVEKLRTGSSSKDRAAAVLESFQRSYDARLKSITESARLFGTPIADVQKELGLLEEQYGKVIQQLQSQLGTQATGTYLGVEK